MFPDPDLRLGLGVFDGRREHSGALEVSSEFPIALVHELCRVESGAELVRAEPKFFRSVAETRTRSPGAPKSRSQRFDVPIRIHGPMQEHQSAAAVQKGVQVLRLIGDPGGIVVVKRDHVCTLPLFRTRPTVGGFDGHTISQGQQFRPALAPQWIIVETGRGVPRVLGRSTKDHA